MTSPQRGFDRCRRGSIRGCLQKLRVEPRADDQHKHDCIESSHDLLGAEILAFILVVSEVAHWTVSCPCLGEPMSARVELCSPPSMRCAFDRRSVVKKAPNRPKMR